MKRLFAALGWLLALGWLGPAQAACSHRLFVSGYFSTVHVYDACTGEYLRNLDVPSKLQGAQAIRLGPDGLIYVVSEMTEKIHRYRADTLAYVDVFADTPIMAPLSLAFAPDGTAYVAGFATDDVKKFDRNGQLIGAAFPPRASGLAGPEIGTTFGPDGKLYVPGFTSNNMIRYDPVTNTTEQVIAPRQGGIREPRGLLNAKDGVNMYVLAAGSNQLFKFNTATNALTLVRGGLSGPTMLTYAVNGELLVVQDSSVVRLDPDTGAMLGTLVPQGSGGLLASTFIALIPNEPPPTPPNTVFEFYNPALDHYFITGDANEARAVDNGAAGAAWARTGSTFRSGGPMAVCRFYGSQSPGPNSHFYTIDAGECQALKDLQAATPLTEKRWNYESLDFLSAPPVNKSCPAGTVPVYRAYNNGFAKGVDSNHRITSDPAAIQQVVAKGWNDEGLVMCAPE